MNSERLDCVFQKIWWDRKDGHTCDFHLIIDGESHPVHKFVLECNTDYFQDLFNEKKPFAELTGVKTQDFNLLLEYMYFRKVSLESKNMNELISALNLAKLFRLNSFLEECRDFALTWPSRGNLGEMYLLLQELGISEQAKMVEECILKRFDLNTKFPELNQISAQLLIASLQNERLDTMSFSVLNARLKILFQWMNINNYGTFKDMAILLEGNPLHPLKIMQSIVFSWLDSTHTWTHCRPLVHVKPESNLKLTLASRAGQNTRFRSVHLFDTHSRNWIREAVSVKSCITSCVKGKSLYYIEEACDGFYLKIYDTKEKCRNFIKLSLSAKFCSRCICVSGEHLYLYGHSIRPNTCIVHTLNLLNGSFQEQSIPQPDSSFSTLLVYENFLYILSRKILYRCNKQNLNDLEEIHRFWQDFINPVMAALNNVLYVFHDSGYQNVNLYSRSSVKIELENFPLHGKVFSVCRYKEGLALALKPKSQEQSLKIGFLKASSDYHKVIYIALAVVPSDTSFYEVIEYTYNGGISLIE